jgi:hypothetical protein
MIPSGHPRRVFGTLEARNHPAAYDVPASSAARAPGRKKLNPGIRAFIDPLGGE